MDTPGELIEITDGDVAKTAGYKVLGPAYFAARRLAERVMAGAEPEPFKEIAKKAAELVREELYDYVETHLLSDVECNIQGHVRRLVENTVEALLTGQEWAIRQYPHNEHQRGEQIRAAVAKHGGEPLLMARIADLEKENERLRESLRWAHER